MTAAYLARAGRKVLVLERRHVLGGAAVTEEVFPGFKFSVCSYVVSLLRPEIIRDLDLPKHGLEILPLDGTFTPMPNGDYLWRVNDHARTRREIARHSKVDAEAYDEYGKAMVEMGRFVKPILTMTPPDPDLAGAARSARPPRPRSAVPGTLGSGQIQPDPADDDERRRFPRSVVRDRRAQGHDVGIGDHRHLPRRAFAGNGLRAAPSLHGRDRRRVPIVGTLTRRHRGDLERDCRRGARGRRGDQDRDRRLQDHRQGRRRGGRGARERRRSHGESRVLERRPEPHVPADGRHRASAGRIRRRDPPLQVPRLVRQGEPRARCASRLHRTPRTRCAPARCDLDLAECRLHGTGLRRRQVRPLSRGGRTSTS